MSNLSTDVRQVANTVAVIDLRGDVTGASENELMDAYTRAAASNPQIIILNFSELAYMNSSGIGLLVTLLIRVQRLQQRLLAYGLNEHYRQIFALTRLDEAIGVYGSEEEALAAPQSHLSG